MGFQDYCTGHLDRPPLDLLHGSNGRQLITETPHFSRHWSEGGAVSLVTIKIHADFDLSEGKGRMNSPDKPVNSSLPGFEGQMTCQNNFEFKSLIFCSEPAPSLWQWRVLNLDCWWCRTDYLSPLRAPGRETMNTRYLLGASIRGLVHWPRR